MENILGNNIKKLRTRDKITQSELGNKLKVSKQVISAYEKGIRKPPYDVLIKIANIFCTTVDSLLSNNLDMYKIDLDGLTESQIEVIIHMIDEFKKSNKN